MNLLEFGGCALRIETISGKDPVHDGYTVHLRECTKARLHMREATPGPAARWRDHATYGRPGVSSMTRLRGLAYLDAIRPAPAGRSAITLGLGMKPTERLHRTALS